MESIFTGVVFQTLKAVVMTECVAVEHAEIVNVTQKKNVLSSENCL